MSDQGFDFRPPAEKRAPKAFEPPPWERDAFEELERKRAHEVAQQESAAVRAAVSEPQEEVRPPETETPATSLGPEAPGPGSEGGGVPESVVLELMAGLAAEEPTATEAYSGVALGTAIFLVALGGVLVVWAMAALVGARVTGWIGQMTGTGLGLFGLFFFGMGVWLLHRTLKQRGVL